MGTENDDENEEGEKKDNKLSQDEVNKLVGKARDDGRKTAVEGLLKELGLESTATLKEFIAKAKEREDKDLSETERLRKENETLKNENSSLKSTGTSEIEGLKLTVAIEKALMAEGMSMTQAEKARRMIQVEKNDPDEIKAEIEALKKEMPAMFQPPEGDKKTPPPPPGTQPRKQNTSGTPRDKARSLLHERHPGLSKNT